MDIRANGQSYSSWDEVPADVRAVLARTLPDADGNGVPDVFEGGPVPTGVTMRTAITVNGQTYDSAGELPAGMQALLKTALGLGQPGRPSEVVAADPTPTPVDPTAPPAPPQPGTVVLNGETVPVGESTSPKKGFLRRIFGG